MKRHWALIVLIVYATVIWALPYALWLTGALRNGRA